MGLGRRPSEIIVEEYMDIRSLDGSLRPTIRGQMAKYVRQLVDTGLYGATPTEVIRNLIRDGLQKAAAANILDVQRSKTK